MMHGQKNIKTCYLVYVCVDNLVLVEEALTNFLEMASEIWPLTNLY